MGISRTAIVVALACLLAAGPSLQQVGDSFVTTLTTINFKQFVPAKGMGVFVNFYMPWCKYSKKLTLDYELLAHAFQRVRHVSIGRVNCEQDKDLCEQHEVSGYPTLKWFPEGSEIGELYKGGRSSQEMIKFVNSKSGIQAKPKQRPNQA
mmetsp:Transcript_15665/g.43825  ORF Transcript_15665/g.43825 Transcript_15665/m.43825 type:complete len:150 (+) Transcript_15665:263-712(+)